MMSTSSLARLLTPSLRNSHRHLSMPYRQDKWTVKWTEKWLNCQAQRVVASSKKFSWRPASGRVLQGWILGTMLFNIVMNDVTESTLSKFSDGTKLGGVDDTAHGFLPLRWTLKNWKNDWQEPHEVHWNSLKLSCTGGVTSGTRLGARWLASRLAGKPWGTLQVPSWL